MGGLSKDRKEPIKQASPMNHEVLMQLFKQVDFSKEVQAVAWVAILVGFCLILWVLNLGLAARNRFDSAQNFVRSDLIFKKGFWTMTVRWMKTIQHFNRILFAPLVPSKFKQICPQYWVTKMVKLIPAADSEPFFLVRSKQGRHALTSRQVGRLLKKWCLGAGLNPKEYTPHCLRRGGLSWAHQARVTRRHSRY